MSRWLNSLTRRRPTTAKRRFAVLPLEDRTVPSAIIVTNNADSGVGSLRWALSDASSGTRPGFDEIQFDPAVVGTITLASPLVVDSDVMILGPGANKLAISGNKTFRIFDVNDGAATSLNVTICGLTVQNGSATSGAGVSVGQNDQLTLKSMHITGNSASVRGGGVDVANGGDLTVIGSTFSGNTAGVGGAAYLGGSPVGGSVTFRNSTVSGNSAGQGGGIALGNFSGDLNLTGVTVVQNKATGGTGGGVVRLSGVGTISMVSTIVASNTTSAGSGADIFTSGTVNYRFSLLGNTAGVTNLNNQGNNLAPGTNPFIGALTNNGGPTPTHALLAGSPAINKGINPAAAQMNDQRGTGYTRSYGTSDIGAYEYTDAGIPTVAGKLSDVATAGGSSYQFELTFADDVFINVANIQSGQDVSISGPNGFFTFATFVSVDNVVNGTPRTATYQFTPPGGFWDGADDGVYTVTMLKNAVYDNAAHPVPAGDIGQFNVAAATGGLVVTNDADSGPGSLRAAIIMANATVGTPDTITFDPTFFTSAKSIVLSSEIFITDAVTIQGLGASIISVSGNNLSGIFNIDNSAADSMVVNISGLTLTAGNVPGSGGAMIIANETVTLSGVNLTNNVSTGSGLGVGGGAVAIISAGSLSATDCVFTGNKATGAGGDGGAIRATDGSTVTLTGCTVSGNSANGDGGAVYMSGTSSASNLLVISSTLANNNAYDLAGDGGAIFFTGTAGAAGLVIRNATISGNISQGYGGGIGANSLVGNMVIQNATVTNNTAGSAFQGGGIGVIGGSGQVMVESAIVSGNFNAKAPDVSTTGKANFKNSALGSKTGIATYVDQGNNLPVGAVLSLGVLANNGGSTFTHLPANGSPLVDRGTNPAGLALDQRGQNRVEGVAADIGAVEIPSPGLPVATPAALVDVMIAGGNTYTITVTYSDETAIKASTIDSNDIRVTGPNGFNVLATLMGVNTPGDGSPRVATYQFVPPGGTWDGNEAGIYSVALESGQVADTSGNFALGLAFGTFKVDLPRTFVVLNANDSGAGSLRDAVQQANLTNAPDTITFDPTFFKVARTITLTTGELLIANPLSITGTGMSMLAVSGNNAARVFQVNNNDASSSIEVTICALTITGGKTPIEGGGIYLYDEWLTLKNVAVTGNSTTTGSGGGIFVADKTAKLTIADSVISNNRTGLVQSGGGIRVQGAASVSISRTSITGNTASLRGGGIYFNNGGSLSITSSTISGNIAQSKDGGGVYFFGAVGLDGFSVRNSTISGNVATGAGGGFAFQSLTGTPIFHNNTITANTSNEGGGIARMSGTGSFELTSNIIAANNGAIGPDLAFNAPTTVTANRNLIGVEDPSVFTLTGSNNLTGTLGSPLDPMLGSLANNGGPTLTHALLVGSPAKDAGSNPDGQLFDQRGPGYLRVGHTVTDIGAYEVQPPPFVAGLPIINDGAAQRSRVTSITVPFVTLVNFSGNVADAFTLEKMMGGVPVASVTLSADLLSSTQSQTMVRLTFSGPLTEYGSLVDGQYRLTAAFGPITDFSGQHLDGNADGVAGDNFVSAPNSIHRLFGDADGDGDVDTNDFGAFRSAFGTNINAYDFDNDGDVDTTDFAQFRLRYGTSV